MTKKLRLEAICFEPTHGAKGQNRTADTALFRRVLYRLSYLGEGRFRFNIWAW